jgi:hypothetical protein
MRPGVLPFLWPTEEEKDCVRARRGTLLRHIDCTAIGIPMSFCLYLLNVLRLVTITSEILSQEGLFCAKIVSPVRKYTRPGQERALMC